MKADVYSFGMTLYEIVTKGDTPYSNLDDLETLRSIEEGVKPILYAFVLLSRPDALLDQKNWTQRTRRSSRSVGKIKRSDQTLQR